MNEHYYQEKERKRKKNNEQNDNEFIIFLFSNESKWNATKKKWNEMKSASVSNCKN